MPGFNPLTATKEEKLAEIKRINKDFKKAGITPMTEEEMEELASDKERVELYQMAQEVAAKIKARETFGANMKGKKYPVLRQFERSRHYFFNIDNTRKAKAENTAIAATLKDEKKATEFVRELYAKIMAIDETDFYAKDLKDQIRIMSEDTPFKMFLHEMEGVFNGVLHFKPQPLTPAQHKSLVERMTIYQTLSFYSSNVLAMSNPYYLLMPHRAPYESVVLREYYEETNQKDKADYAFILRGMPMTLDVFKYGRTAALLLKEKGFMGMPQENVTYECYDDKGKKISTRAGAIDSIVQGEIKSCRILKHEMVKENGQNVVKDYETTLTRDEIIRAYGYNKLTEKYPDTKELKFSENVKIRDIQVAILLHYMPTMPKLNVDDEDQKKKNDKKIAEFIAAVLNGSDDIYAYYINQSQEEQNELTLELLSDERHIPKDFDRWARNYIQDKTGISFAKAERMIEEANALYEKEAAEIESYMDYTDRSGYEKMIRTLIANAKEHNISGYDDIMQDILDYCFKGGAEETETMLAISKLAKKEEELAEKMLDDDSDKLREEYAFVVNLQAKLEAYLDAGTFIEEAKSPTSVYKTAYDFAKYRIQKLEQAAAKVDEKTSPQFKQLTLLAKESMENIRKAIVAEAVGKKKEGIESLRDGRDIGILSLYQTILNSKDPAVREALETRGAEGAVEDLMRQNEILQKNCQKLNLPKVRDLIEDSKKLVEFNTKLEEPAVDNSGVQVKEANADKEAVKSEEAGVNKAEEKPEKAGANKADGKPEKAGANKAGEKPQEQPMIELQVLHH